MGHVAILWHPPVPPLLFQSRFTFSVPTFKKKNHEPYHYLPIRPYFLSPDIQRTHYFVKFCHLPSLLVLSNPVYFSVVIHYEILVCAFHYLPAFSSMLTACRSRTHCNRSEQILRYKFRSKQRKPSRYIMEASDSLTSTCGQSSVLRWNLLSTNSKLRMQITPVSFVCSLCVLLWFKL